MMVVALAPKRRRVIEQLAPAAAPDLGRACPAVMLPAGARRSHAELPAARMFVVEDGVVLVRTFAENGARSMIVARCSAGAILPAPAAAEYLQALTDTWLTAIPHGVWRRLVGVPELAEQLVNGLEETLLRQREASRSLAAVRNTERVRRQLLELAREHGRVCRDGIRIDLPLTHDLISDMVGCARETVTRAFDELQREGFVVRRGAVYQLLVSPEQLYA
jgi:CRP-like cAMP-binding protein